MSLFGCAMSTRGKRDNPGRSKRRFLEAYRQTGRIVEAARIAQIQRMEHYRWLDNDADYARDFEEAYRQSGDILESEAIRRGVEGVREVVLHNGRPVRDPDNPGEWLYRHKYSDQCLLAVLKAKKPEQYRDNFAPTDDDGARIAGKSHAQLLREERERIDAELKELERRESEKPGTGETSTGG